MDCPACQTKLSPKAYCNMEVDVCLVCHGMWLDAGELGAVLRALGQSVHIPPGGQPRVPVIAPQNAREVQRLCPHCHVKMDKLNYAYDSNIFLDRCPTCDGIWADGGEIHKVVLYNLQYHGGQTDS